MTGEFVPVNEPVLDGKEAEYLLECIRSGWISSEGPFVERFEEAMAQQCNRRHAVAVANGSMALDLAVHALDLEPGDEVIMPTFTIISCAAAIVRAGGKPVLVDCDPDTWNMTAANVDAAIGPRTRAIMIVHIYGMPVDLDPIVDLARRNGIAIIEDAAEMLGQTYRGRPCGGFGELSTFSFYPNKHVTTGEGGMVLTNDGALAERLRSLRNLCFKPGRRFVHEELGWNARLTNLQAAVGVAQLERLAEVVARKREIGLRYDELLHDCSGVQKPLACTEYAQNIYWVYGVVLGSHIPIEAEAAMADLARAGIGTRPFFWCIHEQPVFRKRGWFKDERFPNAERIARRGFYLPSGLALRTEQQERSAGALRELLLEYV